MSKLSINISALALTLTLGMSAHSMAEKSEDTPILGAFTGCLPEDNAHQLCKNRCSDTYKRAVGHSTQKNEKRCPDKKTPIACKCDYMIED